MKTIVSIKDNMYLKGKTDEETKFMSEVIKRLQNNGFKHRIIQKENYESSIEIEGDLNDIFDWYRDVYNSEDWKQSWEKFRENLERDNIE